MNEIVCVEDGFLDQQHIVSSPFTLKSIMQTHKKFNIDEIRKNWVEKEDSSFPLVTLPDGTEMTFGNTLIHKCSNLLTEFMNGRKEGGLDMLLTGGGFAFPSFRSTIRNRVENFVNVNKLYSDHEKGYNQKTFYRYSGFLGASILGSLPGYSEFFLKRENYLEVGNNLLISEKDSDLGSLDEERAKTLENRQKFKIVDKMFQ